MPSQEQRRATRINSLNLSYFCIDEDGRITHQGMGRTLNISTTGILLETNEELPISKTIDMEIAMKNDIINASGTIIHSTKDKDETFHTGIHFTKISDKDKETLSTVM
jgi:hypothetical protein